MSKGGTIEKRRAKREARDGREREQRERFLREHGEWPVRLVTLLLVNGCAPKVVPKDVANRRDVGAEIHVLDDSCCVIHDEVTVKRVDVRKECEQCWEEDQEWLSRRIVHVF